MAEIQDIQWFPGHMTKTKRQIKESIKLIDAVAEIVDARVPMSSRNPDLSEMSNNKPRLILLNKCDMADPNATKKWLEYFEKKGIKAIAVDCKSGTGLKQFVPAVKDLLSDRLAALKEKGIIQSMSRKGNCLDNSVMENFFGLLKTEMYYKHKFTSAEHLMREIEEYIDYYNNRRIKCKLKGLSPVQYRIQSNKVA